jgi:hypothetical protein
MKSGSDILIVWAIYGFSINIITVSLDPKFLSDPYGSGSVFVIISVADPEFGIVKVSSTVPHKSIPTVIWASRINSSVC